MAVGVANASPVETVKTTIGQCVYCGQFGAVTDDHIPPKNLFAKLDRKNLITVPSCLDHNGSESKDDEYFRRSVVARADALRHPAAQEAWSSVQRSLQRPRAQGFARDYFESLRLVEIVSPTGLFVGSTLVNAMNAQRLGRVAARIVRGLFFVESGTLLAREYLAIAYPAEVILQAPTPPLVELLEHARRLTQNLDSRVVGSNVFRYWFDRHKNDASTSLWYFQFYNWVEYLGVTVSQSRLPGGHGGFGFP